MDAMKRERDPAKAAHLFREALSMNPAHEDSRFLPAPAGPVTSRDSCLLNAWCRRSRSPESPNSGKEESIREKPYFTIKTLQ
jgi:hypothetical protein